MSLETGTRLGLFEILGLIGAGGMGEVYKARDTRLGREVAIKILPEAFARDPMRVTRFEREARMLASINHPAIAAIYGAEEAGDLRYIVLELVPGDTLAEWMARGALSLEESLSFGRQIAEALEAAHERGVVHRDLKPSNIKVTPDGKIKVLDLGLAKAMMEEQPKYADPSKSPTLVLRDDTRPGVILGTAEFMSPEQARGKEVDKRTDIWAFGCILFEMLSGRRAFSGETVSDILASILAREPDWEALPAYTPIRVRELLSRCLAKDANQRLRDIGEARVEIERTLSGTDGEPESGARRRPAWVVAATLALLLAGGGLWILSRRGSETAGATPSERSLVVLPASVLSDSPGGQLVGDGLVETLSVRLNQVPGIQIVTPSAAVAASDKNADPFNAAKSVGANLLVRSSVVRSGDRVRIIYSVWNVQTRFQVAGGTVDGSASDLFGMQDELAQNVAASLKLRQPAQGAPTATGLETASQQERYIQALGYLQRYDKSNSIGQGIQQLETLAAERPGAALVHAALARACLLKHALTRERSLVETAERESARAQELEPNLPDVLATVGELRLRTGQPAEAVAAFRSALAVQPNNFDALQGLARASEAAGDAIRAEDSYRRAIALQPSYFGGYSKLGGFYFNQGKYREASEMFRRVTQLAPDNSRAFANLGGAYQLMGEFEKALEAYKRSLALEPTNTAYSNLGTTQFFLGHYKDATEAFEAAVRLSPDYFQLWANLGDAYRWTKGSEKKASEAYGKAIVLCREELRLNPRNALVHSYLALSLAKTGLLEEAQEHSRQALASEEKNPEVLYNTAIVANLNHRPEEALKWISMAVQAGYPTVFIAREPEFESLREKKEFQQLSQGVKSKSI